MGPVCYVYGLAHIVKPIKDPYGAQIPNPQGQAHKGPMRGPDTKPKWAQCGMYMSTPI